MNNGEFSVTAEDLTRRFGDFTAVDHISFQVPRGEIFGFLGANGAGKTTTIRMLCGLLMPSDGRATVAGFNVSTEAERIKQHIGYMSQRFSLYEDLTVRENIQFYGGIYGLGRAAIVRKTEQLLDQLGLWDHADTLTASLPLGWKQRMALSTALLHDPPIVFLDEPTSGVDPESRRRFWLLIYELAAGRKTVFVTTHFMDEAEYCQRVLIMRDGRIIELDRPSRLRDKYGVRSMQDVFMRAVGEDHSVDEWLSLIMEFGQVNLKCMALLDEANTSAYGHPVPTKVSMKVEKGPFIVVTGHDLLDLKHLLEQTDGKGINIYTHGEMLPAHGYPELKKYSHLKGNYGTA